MTVEVIVQRTLVVAISLYRTTTSALPVSVSNTDDSFTIEYAAGSQQTLPDITVTLNDGTTIEYPSVKDFIQQWTALYALNEDGDPQFQVLTFPTGGIIVIPNITLIEVDGTTSSQFYSDEITATFKTFRLKSSDGVIHASITSYPSEGNYMLENVEHTDSDGNKVDWPAMTSFVATLCKTLSELIELSTAAEINAAMSPAQVTDMQALICEAPTPSELTPNYQIPQRPLVTFYSGDLGYLYANGFYNRCFVTDQCKYVLDADDPYYLDASTPNPWSTIDRFVFDNGDAAWNGTTFISATPGATPYIVIDVWSGLYIYTPNLGSLSAFSSEGFVTPYAFALDKCLNLSVGSYTGFRPISKSEMLAILPNPTQLYYHSTNLLLRGTVSGFNETQFYLSETDNAGTNAFVLTASGDITRRAVSTVSLTTVYAVKNWN